jgi:hypothetical protein
MTMFKPNIRVERLQVAARGTLVYDERFHAGLNIIRGENSSGKSTLMDFIFYALGGDLSDWRESAARCDAVILQVALNGRSATLSRDIGDQIGRPMRIFMGTIEESKDAGQEQWQLYPYARGSKDSFSQVIFRFLGLPEVQYAETETKITINQILRLIYADQLSPVEKLFRPQRFDEAITRQTVGELLCGAFSAKYYNAQIRLGQANKEFDIAEAQIKALIRSHGRDGHPLTVEWFEAETASYQKQLENTNNEITELEEKIFYTQFDDRLSLNDQEETYNNIVTLQSKIARTQEEIDSLELERSDSIQFINALDEKLNQLNQSDTVIDEFKTLKYEYCPACLAPIKGHDVEGACGLCKMAYDPRETKSRSLKFINEFARQRQESMELQEERIGEIERLREDLATFRSLWEQASRHYQVAVRSPTTELRLRLRELNRAAGYLMRKIEDLAGKAGVIEQLASLSKATERLRTEIRDLKATIETEKIRNSSQVARAKTAIADIVVEFLKRDLARQITFQNAETVTFEFDGDRIAVNGDSFFSASSMVYLKNSFLAAFCFAAAQDPTFNHPRFLLMDTVEDKGMEPLRSQNFQKLLFEYAQKASSENQIIIATSMIAPELNIPEITVGDFYTHDSRTLTFGNL